MQRFLLSLGLERQRFGARFGCHALCPNRALLTRFRRKRGDDDGLPRFTHRCPPALTLFTLRADGLLSVPVDLEIPQRERPSRSMGLRRVGPDRPNDFCPMLRFCPHDQLCGVVARIHPVFRRLEITAK